MYLAWEKDMAVVKIQTWWRKLRSKPQKKQEKEESNKQNWAALVIQSAARKWLMAKQSTPAWSQLLAQRVISEERARALHSEIEVWQQRHNMFNTDKEEANKLHMTSQERYRRFVAGTGARRLAEHRTGLVTAQLQSTVELLQSAPSLQDYQHEQWSQFHSLPLDIATAARVDHLAALEKLKWPEWKRKIEDIIQN